MYPYGFLYLLLVRRFVKAQDLYLDTGNEVAHVRPFADCFIMAEDNLDLPSTVRPTSVRTTPLLVCLTLLVFTPSVSGFRFRLMPFRTSAWLEPVASFIKTASSGARVFESFVLVGFGADVSPPFSFWRDKVASAPVRVLGFFV